MKLITLIFTTALLIGCSSSQPKQTETFAVNETLYPAMGIQKDPKEKNPLFYEVPGRWQAKGTDQDCENSWTQLTISEDRKHLTISQETSEKANAPEISQSLPFKIEKASRTSLSLTEHSAAAEAWEIKMPTLTFMRHPAAPKGGKVEALILTALSLTQQNDPEFAIKYSRCIKDMQITVGEPVKIEGVDLSESIEKTNEQ